MQNMKVYSDVLADYVVMLFKQFKYPVIVIYGNPDTGKTDTALLLCEIAKDKGVLDYFASNINTFGAGERITSLEELDYWFKYQTGRKCFILDEAGIHDDSRSPLSRLNRAIRHEVFVIRKFFGHVIFVLQELADLDKWKNSELTGAIIRKDRIGDRFIAEFKTKFDRDKIVFNPFPRTSINFNSLDIAPFTLEKELNEWDVKLKGLPYQVAYLYAHYGNLSVVAKELEPEIGKRLRNIEVKRLLIKYLRESLRIEVKRGRQPQKIKVLTQIKEAVEDAMS